MKNIIVICKDGEPIGAWGTLSEISRQYEWVKMGTVKDKTFPFFYKGHFFHKLPYRKKQ